MNKILLRLQIGVWLVITPALLFAQGFGELNQYKYFLVKSKNMEGINSTHIQNSIERYLTHRNIPIYHSREDIDRLNAKECEILQIFFQSQTGVITVIPFVEVEIQFYNCQNRLLYAFRERKASSLFDVEKSYEKVVEKALRPLRKYQYQYQSGANLKSHSKNRSKNTSAPIILSDVDENIPQTRNKNSKAIAVVIGNKDYQDRDIPAVDFALNDARTVKRYLTESFGFLEENILYYENATQANFNALFGTTQNPQGLLHNYISAGESDVFVFYSGHGMPDVEQKTGYFVPVDCQASLITLNGYALNTFYENLAKIPYKSLTVLIDACFSGGSEKGFLIKQASPIYIKSKNKVINRGNTLVLLSSPGDQISSWYPEKNHSLFTYYFLKGIQGKANENGDRRLSLLELKEYIDKEVIYKARRLHNRNQTPEIYGPEHKIVVSYE